MKQKFLLITAEAGTPVRAEPVEALRQAQGERIEARGQRMDAQGERIEARGQRMDAQGERMDAPGQRMGGRAVA